MHGIKLRGVLTIGFSSLFWATAFFGYADCMRRCVEMTFLSNAGVGAVLFCAGVYSAITGRRAPHVLFLNCAVLLTLVFCVCAFFAPGVCFTGMSVLPHVITPTAMLTFYFAFCDGRGCSPKNILTATVFPNLYYAFMIIYGRASGSSIYVYFDSNSYPAVTLFAIAVLAFLLIITLAMTLLYCNCKLRAFVDRRSAARIGQQ